MKELKLIPIILIAFAVLSRLLPHPANFAPITALALFGGVYLPKKYAFVIPIFGMLISDYFIGFYGISMILTYFSFFVSGLIGLWLKNHKSILNIFGSSLISSIIFFLITNQVFFYPHTFYTKDLAGLLNSYYMGIPFFKNTLLGDLFYIGVLFGLYELGFYFSKKFLSKKYLALF